MSQSLSGFSPPPVRLAQFGILVLFANLLIASLALAQRDYKIGDADGDGYITITDINIIISSFGEAAPWNPSTPCPALELA